MSRKRVAAFIGVYGIIVLTMLFVYFFVQKEYGSDPTKPYQRRFLFQLPMLERSDSRLSFSDWNMSGLAFIQSAIVDKT